MKPGSIFPPTELRAEPRAIKDHPQAADTPGRTDHRAQPSSVSIKLSPTEPLSRQNPPR